MNDREKLKLIDDLKLLPGHQYKFEDMFTFLETIYPRESAARELKRSSNNPMSSPENEQRFIAISGSNPKRWMSAKHKPIHNKTKKTKRSLMKKYEKLDVAKRDEINKRFLNNLKIKGGISLIDLCHQVYKPASFIDKVFPPDQFGYEDILSQWALAYSGERTATNYNKVKADPIIEEDDEEEANALSYTHINKSINDEIDSMIKHISGNAVESFNEIKQKDIIIAQNRAKHRIELAKKKEEVSKLKEAKKEIEDKQQK